MSTSPAPTVSICLPVYNGERYLEEAIRGVLGQSLTDFELIIADNGSTDRTAEICQTFAASDSRIRVARNDINRGLAWNFNRAFDLARGRYVVWQGCDDIMRPGHVARCIETLNRDSEAVLCFTQADEIDSAGQISQATEFENPGESDDPAARLHRVLFDALCQPIFGVMRADVLRQTRLHLPYADSDRVLLAEMALRGRFVFLPDREFQRRMHAGQATSQCVDRWERSLIFDPSWKGRNIVPWLRQVRDLVRAIRRAPLSRKNRWKSYKALSWWIRAHRREIASDAGRGLKVCAGMLTFRSAELGATATVSSVNG